MSANDDRYEVAPNVGNHFAWLRTQMGLQRTLMAAARTAVSLIGFGFTVAQFFERMQDSLPEGAKRVWPQAPRNLGLVLIGAGVVSLAVFTWQFRSADAYLRGGPYSMIAQTGIKPRYAAPYITAYTVMLIGVAAFVSVLYRF